MNMVWLGVPLIVVALIYIAVTLFRSKDHHHSGGSSHQDKKMKSISPEEVSMLILEANSIMIVPGYGLAVAQAQSECKKLVDKLNELGKTVCFGLHPFAGRISGHMTVLLAEAGIEYKYLTDIDSSNDVMADMDLVLVSGANDIVNPVAKTDPSSPLYGMPILNVSEAKKVVVLKQGMGSGYSGIVNMLYYYDNTFMLYGDSKKSFEMINYFLNS